MIESGKAPSSDPPSPLGEGLAADVAELANEFEKVGQLDALGWASKFDNMRVVGRGGQGVVFRCERSGVDGFRLPVALKAFTPAVYDSAEDYEADMARIAAVAMQIGQLQNHQLLDTHNFIDQNRIRIMVMEWINGYDLSRLLSAPTLSVLRDCITDSEWAHLNDVVLTQGPYQSRLKPGVAIRILRECLTGLASLHRAGVAHGDVKPGNVMVKRTGNVKLVDFGSAVDMNSYHRRRACTPAYAAPEILEGAPNSPQSDLASLGYVLVEMLSGHILFQQADSLDVLLPTKCELHQRLPEILPPDVVRNEELMSLCHGLVHPDPGHRMGSAEEANIIWAAKVHRQLVKTDLDSEYENELRFLMESLPSEALAFPTTNPPQAIPQNVGTTLADWATTERPTRTPPPLDLALAASS